MKPSLVAWEQYRLIYLDGTDALREIPAAEREEYLHFWHHYGALARYVKTFYPTVCGQCSHPIMAKPGGLDHAAIARATGSTPLCPECVPAKYRRLAKRGGAA